ncbi:unnamed protein product [Rhizoctonia solani]|uniref:Uncharacterized protein n=1 Tax=Rhizoctonia solani TaxID=456999 RepID=A0A8H3CC42_9AGAM|nr:unnamed protein product [Rhizoctonia solani]
MMCILLLRVWALWGRKPWMLIALLLVFASSQLPPALLVGKTIQKLEVIDNPLPGLLTGCVTTSSSSASAHWVQLFISSLTYESTLFLLTLVRAWSLNRRGAGTPIMTLMTRDGAWYFLVVIGMGQAYVTTTSADGYYSIRRFDSAGNLDSKDSNGSSPFTVLCCHDLVHMLSLAPPTSRVLYPSRSKYTVRRNSSGPA